MHEICISSISIKFITRHMVTARSADNLTSSKYNESTKYHSFSISLTDASLALKFKLSGTRNHEILDP